MTKEEILLKMVEEMPYEISSETKPYLMEAMDIYAQQEAIAFAEWTSQTLKWQKKSKKELWLNNETLSVVTTKELYHIFKNNQ